VVAIEVKAAIDVDRGDLRHLEFLSERLGPAFVGGVLLHCGNRPRRWAQNLVSLPVSSLWRT
jgi:hypothetical protein